MRNNLGASPAQGPDRGSAVTDAAWSSRDKEDSWDEAAGLSLDVVPPTLLSDAPFTRPPIPPTTKRPALARSPSPFPACRVDSRTA